MDTLFWGLGAAFYGGTNLPVVATASLWTQLFSGEQLTHVLTRLIDTLPATLMATAALVTALKARHEARAATAAVEQNAKENSDGTNILRNDAG